MHSFLTPVFSSLVALTQLVNADLPPGYQGLSAQEKQNILWEQISKTPYTPQQLPSAAPSRAELGNIFNASFLAVGFTLVSDEFPKGRPRILHVYGSAAKVVMNIYPNSTYTGIFKSGGVGIARLSLASPDPRSYAPGMGLKILVDERPSLNFHVLATLDGQAPNRNFFENPFANIIGPPHSEELAASLAAFPHALLRLPGGPDNRPESEINLPVYGAASFDRAGKAIKPVIAPFWVTFLPNKKLGYDPATKMDFRNKLAEIPVGSTIYTVSVRRTDFAKEELIGELVTQSSFVASKYVDQSLFFQHQTKRWKPS